MVTRGKTPELPAAAGLDIAACSRIFENTAASYKFLWTLALLNILRRGRSQVAPTISLQKMAIEMVKEARDPIERFRLNFGAHDDMAKYIGLYQEGGKKYGELRRKLCTWVDTRWLRPFFAKETKGVRPDKKLTAKLRELANRRFDRDEEPPPYRFVDIDGEPHIQVHPRWAEYFRSFAPIINGWVLWHWARFLQARNPNIPAVIHKIDPWFQRARGSLITARKFWEKIIEVREPLACIYSEERLRRDDFVLDHYLPWSFVGHNDLWNLVPTSQPINSSKSDHFPHAKYLERFVEMQHGAINAYREMVPGRSWEKKMESHAAGLNLGFDDLPKRDKLDDAYRSLVAAQTALGKSNAFGVDWEYDPDDPDLAD